MKKSDLKTGMLIEIGNNLCLVYHGTAIGLGGGIGGIDINSLENSLEDVGIYKVTKVWQPKKRHYSAGMGYWIVKNRLLEYADLLWERKEENMITIKGKKYSEETIHEALKNHIGE